jgi:hypothetical protein
LSTRELSPSIAAILVALATPAGACPVIEPDDEALVAVDLPGVGRLDVELSWFASGWCSARLEVPHDRLPARRLAPRPADVAEAVGRVAERRWDSRECSVAIWVSPPEGRALDVDDFVCISGRIARDRAGWFASEDEDC